MGGPNWCIGSPVKADEEGEVVAALFDADAFGGDGDQQSGVLPPGTAAAANAVLHVVDADAFFGTLRQMDHAGAVKRDDGFLRIVVEVLADDEDGLAVAVAVGVGEGDVGRERDVAGHLLPEIAELIARVPDVVAGGVDGVLLGGGVVAGAAGDDGAADVGLAVEDADGCRRCGWGDGSPPAERPVCGWRSRGRPRRGLPGCCSAEGWVIARALLVLR